MATSNKAKDTTDQVLNDYAQPKNCFIVTPIGQIDSDTFKKAFGLINAVIKPILGEFNYKAVAASDISSSGSINRQIIKHLVEDDLVIANLTGLNPNVMYELAIRHAVRKPVVLMIEDGSKLPFDVFDQRTVFYNDNLNGVKDAKETLREFVSAALKDEAVQNPIYDSIEASTVLQKFDTPDSPFQLIVDRLDRIESSLITKNSPKKQFLTRSEKYRIIAELKDSSLTLASLTIKRLRDQFNIVSVTWPVPSKIVEIEILVSSDDVLNLAANALVSVFNIKDVTQIVE